VTLYVKNGTFLTLSEAACVRCTDTEAGTPDFFRFSRPSRTLFHPLALHDKRRLRAEGAPGDDSAAPRRAVHAAALPPLHYVILFLLFIRLFRVFLKKSVVLTKIYPPEHFFQTFPLPLPPRITDTTAVTEMDKAVSHSTQRGYDCSPFRKDGKRRWKEER
jgi:hypothetical protein